MPDNTIAGAFDTDHAERHQWIERARDCCALTIPAMLPEEDFDAEDGSPQNYQSIGARIISNLQGKLLTTVYPIGRSWVRYELDADLRAEMDESTIAAVEDQLYLREILLRSSIESADPGPRRRGFGGFRAGKRTTFGRLLTCGDTLEVMDDQFRIRSPRSDAYTQRRDSSGDIIHHTIKERIDPLTLPEDELATIDLDTDELRDKPPHDRMEDLFTRVHWNPETRVWVIEQEINGHIFRTSQETVSPFFSTAYDLIPPEHYGRSFVELNLYADLRSSDVLTERILEFAALACKHHPCVDAASNVTEEDLMKPSGYPIMGARVVNGVVQDIGWLRAEKLAEFSMVKDVLATVDARLGSAGLLDSASVRDSERTTAYEIANVTLRELEGALGGVYAAIADEQQIPLAERAEHLLARKKGWPKLPDGVRITTVTGLAALNREADAQRSIRMLEMINQMDPEDRAWFKKRPLFQILAHESGLDRPDIVLTEDEFRKQAQEKAAEQIKMAAAGQGIESAGRIAEARATQTTK